MAETDRQAEEATEKQIAFLCGRGMWRDGITKGCASWLIDVIQRGVDFPAAGGETARHRRW